MPDEVIAYVARNGHHLQLLSHIEHCLTMVVFWGKLDSPMETRTAEQSEALSKELSELSQQQSEALKIATYIPMTAQEAAIYDKRRERIGELGKLLGKYKAKP
jgi:hypothetical protein